MASSTTYETATLYGALDSLAATDGDALTAHILRALAMSHNRMMSKAAPMCNLVWPITSTIDKLETSPNVPPGLCVAPVVDSWADLTESVVVPKMPGHNFADAKIYIRPDTAAVVYVTICTRGSPMTQARTSSHALVAATTASATWQTLTIADIPLAPGDIESVYVLGRAASLSTLGSEASFGAPNSWTVATALKPAEPRKVWGPSTAAWNLTTGAGDSWAEHPHILRVWDASTDDIVQPRAILYVTYPAGTTDHELHVLPEYTTQELDIIQARGDTYRIETVQRVSIGNVSIASRRV